MRWTNHDDPKRRTDDARPGGERPRVAVRGAIASPHHLATEAGERAYAAGGNAIDAALAAAAALTVVYPHNTALGGDLMALVRTPDGKVTCVNATGAAPASVDRGVLRGRYGARLPVRGSDVITVPGLVGGLAALHDLGARRSWADHLGPAVTYARDGVPVARSLARAIVADSEVLAADPGCSAVFRPHGVPLGEGDLLVQKPLAASLAELADEGPRALYTGSLGARLTMGLQALGCPLTSDDLSDFRLELPEPLSVDFAGHRVVTSPPNTQGFVLLRVLLALKAIDADAAPGEIDPAVLARLFLDANALRDARLADPRSTPRDLHEHDLDALTASLGEPRPPSPASHVSVATGDTVGISAADDDGYAVSIIESVFHAFGSGLLEPSTGILTHNRGRSFSLDPASPNAIGPGRRPRHTLMPVLVERDGDCRWVNSTMGGQGQPQIHARLLFGLLGGATPQEAVSAPRWALGPKSPSDTPDTIYAEANLSPEVRRRLAADRFVCKEVPALTDWMGHANVVSAGDLDAAADPRSDGKAAVVAIRAS